MEIASFYRDSDESIAISYRGKIRSSSVKDRDKDRSLSATVRSTIFSIFGRTSIFLKKHFILLITIAANIDQQTNKQFYNCYLPEVTASATLSTCLLR